MKILSTKPWSTLLFFGLAFFIVYGLALISAYFGQSRQIYYPPPPTAKKFDAFIENDHKKLGGWVVPQNPQHALVVFGGNAQSLLKMSATGGLSSCTDRTLILFPYRGYEGNPGVPREKDLIEDAQKVVLWAQQQYKHVSVLGISLGSGVAVGVASKNHDLDAVLLGTPYDSMVNVAHDLMPWLLPKLLMKDTYDSASRAPNVSAPIFILRAKQDQIILPPRTAQLIQSFKNTVTEEYVLEGNHDTIWSNRQACEWIRQKTQF